MDLILYIYNTFLQDPLLNVLVIIFQILNSAGIPGALSIAVVALTVIIRMALWPLTSKQLKSSQKMAELRPHLDKIKKDHGHDKVRHQQEVTKLYKDHGVNPAAGCLPLLFQLPVFIALYQTLLDIVEFEKADFLASINDKLYFPSFHLKEIPNTSFFGFKLEQQPSDWQQVGIVILLVPIITGGLQFIQSKMMSPQKPKNALVKKEDEKKKESLEDSMAQMQSQMIFIMPAMIAFFSYGFPLGLSLYWNTFTVIGIIQQYKVAGAGSLNKYLPKKWQKQK